MLGKVSLDHNSVSLFGRNSSSLQIIRKSGKSETFQIWNILNSRQTGVFQEGFVKSKMEQLFVHKCFDCLITLARLVALDGDVFPIEELVCDLESFWIHAS